MIDPAAPGREAARHPPLDDSTIHLWVARQLAPSHRRHLDSYAALLSAEERESESRFHFEHDRIRYRVTRAMVRLVLARYLGIRPAECVFHTNAFGRPALSNPEAGAARLVFNLSHTRDLILLGATRGRQLGVDVERICERRASADIAVRFFAPEESEHLMRMPEHARADVFFRYWTLKESYIKARGQGLSIPLDKFGFNLRDGGVELWLHPDLGDDARRWAFIEMRPTNDHRGAICFEAAPRESVDLWVQELDTLE